MYFSCILQIEFDDSKQIYVLSLWQTNPYMVCLKYNMTLLSDNLLLAALSHLLLAVPERKLYAHG